ncbi:hypothetical protein D9M72_185590 [compost metagenome]
MCDAPRTLSHTQREVIVLRKIELRAEAADSLHQRLAVDAQMTDIHAVQQQHRVPIGLCEDLDRPASLVGLALVRICHVDRGIFRQPARDRRQRVVRQQIVVVQQRDKFASRSCQRKIRRTGNTAVGLREDHLDA